MIIVDLKKNISKILAILVIAAQLIGVSSFLLVPTPAEACQIFGTGPTCNFTLVDVPAAIKQIVTGVIEKVAVNYANKYLTKFVQQVSDKYRIKDFLFYNQYLSDYYISNLILKNVSDPNLRQALNITNSIYVTGQFNAFCSKSDLSGATINTQAACTQVGGAWKDPRGALIPQLKLAMAKVYTDQGGIDPSKVYTPAPGVSDREYFATAQAYFANPPSFTEQNLQGQFGAFQSAATTAAQLEVTVGNGLKAGRVIGGFCSNQDDSTDWGNTNGGKGWDPVSCAAAGGKWNESLVDQARSLITNPTAFIDQNIDKAIGSIFGNNFDASNPYTQIGQALGNFLFTKLDLNTSGSSSTLSDGGSYNANSYGNGANSELIKTIDLDHDGIPDVQDNDKDGKVSVGDTCYNGLVNPAQDPTQPPVCIPSSDPRAAGSAYFTPFCQSSQDAIDELKAWVAFQEAHKNQIKDNSYDGTLKDQTDFADNGQADYQVWAEFSSRVGSSTDALLSALKGLNASTTNQAVDDDIFNINRYNIYIGFVTDRLFADHDTDHIGKYKDGFRTVHDYSAAMLTYILNIRGTVVNCASPNIQPVPPPPDFSLPSSSECSPAPTAAQTQETQAAIDFMIPLLNAITPMNPVVSPPPQNYQAAVQAIVDQVNTKYPDAGAAYANYVNDNVIAMVFNYIGGPVDHVVSAQDPQHDTGWINAWRVTCP